MSGADEARRTEQAEPATRSDQMRMRRRLEPDEDSLADAEEGDAAADEPADAATKPDNGARQLRRRLRRKGRGRGSKTTLSPS